MKTLLPIITTLAKRLLIAYVIAYGVLSLTLWGVEQYRAWFYNNGPTEDFVVISGYHVDDDYDGHVYPVFHLSRHVKIPVKARFERSLYCADTDQYIDVRRRDIDFDKAGYDTVAIDVILNEYNNKEIKCPSGRYYLKMKYWIYTTDGRSRSLEIPDERTNVFSNNK